MMLRFSFKTLFILLLGLVPLTSLATPSIENLSDLKEIQKKVHSVVEKVLPATVSLYSTENGASGSGVIVSKDGIVLTAAHVVQVDKRRTLREIELIFPNGKLAKARVIGAHYSRDSAMLKIIDTPPAGGWPHVKIGNSKDLVISDLVVALGHPSGYDPTRTPPVRFGRVISKSDNHFFSTDCSIIGGDSGGPLFDLDGKLIGIHSFIKESISSNYHAGLTGFQQDWEKLLAGKIWGTLGEYSFYQGDSPVIGIETGFHSQYGVFIRGVVPNGPADAAGLQRDDIIKKINDEEIINTQRLHREIANYSPSDTINVHVLRDGRNHSFAVKLSRRDHINNLLKR